MRVLKRKRPAADRALGHFYFAKQNVLSTDYNLPVLAGQPFCVFTGGCRAY